MEPVLPNAVVGLIAPKPAISACFLNRSHIHRTPSLCCRTKQNVRRFSTSNSALDGTQPENTASVCLTPTVVDQVQQLLTDVKTELDGVKVCACTLRPPFGCPPGSFTRSVVLARGMACFADIYVV